MPTVSPHSVFTTEPLLLTCWHHSDFPPIHIHAPTLSSRAPLFWQCLSQRSYCWPLWEGSEWNVRRAVCNLYNLRKGVITQLIDKLGISTSWYFWNNVRPNLHLPSCLAKSIWQPWSSQIVFFPERQQLWQKNMLRWKKNAENDDSIAETCGCDANDVLLFWKWGDKS